MRVIVLGTGEVGLTLAANLAGESVDMTVVCSSEDKLLELREHYDIQTVQGTGSHPDVLRRAGAEDCDLLIAVTNSDELNMLACQVAFSLFRVPLRVARIRNSAYLQDERLFSEDHLPINVLINPDSVVTEQIGHLINYSGARRVMDFADGKVQIVEVVLHESSPLAAIPLKDWPQKPSDCIARAASVYRDNKAIVPTADTVLMPGDQVFLATSTAQTKMLLKKTCAPDQPLKRIMIAGGGNIGERVAQGLEDRYSVKIIEPIQRRCNQLAESLRKTVVLCGSATDAELLGDEQVQSIDMFCALTNNDEINIMSSLLAKRMGARKTVVLVNKNEYIDMLDGNDAIDIVFSPRQSTLSLLLSYIRRAHVIRAYSLRRSNAEVVEMVVHGDSHSSQIVGRLVNAIAWPEGVFLCTVVRGDEVKLLHYGKLAIESGDHLIFFLVDKNHLQALEQLVQIDTLSF